MSSNVIVMVDDNSDDFFAASRTLSRAGLANPLVHIESGEAVIEYLRGTGAYAKDGPSRPALVLLDINMPGMKGTEVLRILRDDPALKNLPVIMLTSSNADRDVLASFEGGAHSYINKPISMSALLDSLPRIRNHKLEIRLVPAQP